MFGRRRGGVPILLRFFDWLDIGMRRWNYEFSGFLDGQRLGLEEGCLR